MGWIGLGAMALALAGVGGCASAPGSPAVWDDASQNRWTGSGVFPSEGVRAYERSLAATPDSQRFEHGRLDGYLGVQREAALRATRQWPQQPRPAERPVRFFRWQQR